MKNSGDFMEAFEKLNKNQREAVKKIDGPVMVIAGPGTGKTQVLTLRIAYILKQIDVSPDSVLALTFTEAATREMRERLVKLIGKNGYQIRVGTFHSFCQEVIRSNPEKFLIGEESENLSDLERNEIVQKIVLEKPFEAIKPAGSPLFYVSSILSAIRNLKREGVSVEDFSLTLERLSRELEEEKQHIGKTEILRREKDLKKNLELLSVYKLYQEELIKRGRFDFEDMINFVVEAFKNDGDFLLSYQEKFNYILVDEYQDTNSAQNKIVFLLASFWGKEANVFAVGDPNQSIFRFQGASMENFQELLKRFPNTTLINLTDNYRSTQLILDSAHNLIKNNKTQFSQLKKDPLVARSNEDKKKIGYAFFSRGIYEDYFIQKTIFEQKVGGVSFSEMAVVARHNQDLKELGVVLKKAGIPVVVEGGENVLRTVVVKKVIKLLRTIKAVDSGSADIELFDLLYEDYLGFEKLEVVKFLREGVDKKCGSLMKALFEAQKNSCFHNLAANLSKWRGYEKNLIFTEFFGKLIEESGILNYILKQKNSVQYLNQLNSLFNEIKREVAQNHKLNLNIFLDNIDLMEKQNISIEEETVISNPEAVTLTTVHKAKGREWRRVFIYRFVDGKWGNNRGFELIKLPTEILEFGGENYDQNEEERRLFYVALTRARDKVIISGAKNYETSYGNRECLPALFVGEIGEDKLKIIEASKFETEAGEVLKNIYINEPESGLIKGEEVYLKELVANLKISVTALNTYLTCPYKFKLNNLYRIPKAKEEYLSFGTAVHRALELFHQKYIKEKRPPTKDYLVSCFERALEREVLTEEGFGRRKDQGVKILSAYYDFYRDKFKMALATEKYFGYADYSRVMFEDIPLTGKVDRIETINELGDEVRLIDYKTGKPKSRNEIEGKTKTSDGSYKRQLVFYQLLTDLDKGFKQRMAEAELDFVEPDEGGKFKKEKFVISLEEVDELKKIIREVMSEIRKFHFERTRDYSRCATCEYIDHCWPEGVPKTSGQSNLDK